MKKISILLTLAGAFVFGQSLDVQATTQFSPIYSTEGTNQVILEQIDDLNNGIVSDYFTDLGGGTYCADDFDMPFDGKLTSLTAFGFNNGGNFMSDTTSVRFFIFADDGGMWIPESSDPETEHLYKFDVPLGDPALTIDDEGRVYITLDLEVLGENVYLEEDEKYWLSVAPVMDNTGAVGDLRWNWLISSTSEAPGEASLIDPDDLFESGLTNWTPITDIGLDTGNLAMRIEGEPGLGVNDFGQQANFVVYPNPTVNFVKVKTYGADVKEMVVYSIDGKQVASSNTSTVRVTSLPAGVYVVKVMDTNGKVHTTKVIKK